MTKETPFWIPPPGTQCDATFNTSAPRNWGLNSWMESVYISSRNRNRSAYSIPSDALFLSVPNQKHLTYIPPLPPPIPLPPTPNKTRLNHTLHPGNRSDHPNPSRTCQFSQTQSSRVLYPCPTFRRAQLAGRIHACIAHSERVGGARCAW